jgi:4Fe-4S ferredoxin
MSKKLSAFQIYKLLPKTNCKKCGEQTCMAFATKLLNQERAVEECPLLEEPKYKKGGEELKEIFSKMSKVHPSGVTVDPELCTGCGNCVTACPVNVRVCEECAEGGPITDKEVLYKVVDGKLQIVNLDECRRVKPPKTSCNVCEVFCLSKAIKIVGV